MSIEKNDHEPEINLQKDEGLTQKEKEKTEPVLKEIIDFLNSQEVLELEQRQLEMMLNEKFGINYFKQLGVCIEKDERSTVVRNESDQPELKELYMGPLLIIKIAENIISFPTLHIKKR